VQDVSTLNPYDAFVAETLGAAMAYSLFSVFSSSRELHAVGRLAYVHDSRDCLWIPRPQSMHMTESTETVSIGKYHMPTNRRTLLKDEKWLSSWGVCHAHDVLSLAST
jgi:hypothetical protein